MPQVAPVGREVLRHEDDLGNPEPVDLGEDRVLPPGTLRTPELGNRTEPASAVAALSDLHVRPGRLRARAYSIEEVDRDGPLDPRAPAGAPEVHRDPHVDHRVDLGEGPGELLPRPGGETAGHDETGAGTPLARDLQDHRY